MKGNTVSEHILSTRQILAGITAGGALAAALVTGVPHAQAAALFVPGTGSTTSGGADTVDLSWLDGGRLGATAACICDSNQYPAALGPGVGNDSVARGKEAVVQYLLAHPEVDTVVGGSQGAGVAYEAAMDPRLAGRTLHLRLYSNMDTPGTGARARGVKGQDIPFTGLEGGETPNTSGPGVDITSTNHEWDPIANAPKYQASYLWTVPTGIVGFLVYHGALGGPYGAMQINYDGATVTKTGNHTVITLKDPLTPWGQLATIVVSNVAGERAGFVFQTLIKPADDVLSGFLKATGGYDVPGVATVGPTTPRELQHAAQHLINGFTKAAQDFAAIPARLAAGPKPKVTTPPASAEPPASTPSSASSITLTAEQTAKAVSKPKAEDAEPAKVDKAEHEPAPIKVDKPAPTKADKPQRSAPKASGNPVHDTVKTVQGALKRFAPKPKPAPKAASSQHDSAGESK